MAASEQQRSSDRAALRRTPFAPSRRYLTLALLLGSFAHAGITFAEDTNPGPGPEPTCVDLIVDGMMKSRSGAT